MDKQPEEKTPPNIPIAAPPDILSIEDDLIDDDLNDLQEPVVENNNDRGRAGG